MRARSDGSPDDRAPVTSPTDDATAMTAAVRLARAEAAEQMDVVTDLREAEILRLEVLEEALAARLATRAACDDLFDIGVSRGAHPRLFLDAVAFIDMGRDRRTYRFQQDTRTGRRLVCESPRVQTIVAAVTTYVARRLVERERALGSADAGAEAAAAAKAPARRTGVLAAMVGILVDLLGTAVLVLLVLLGLWYLGSALLAGR